MKSRSGAHWKASSRSSRLLGAMRKRSRRSRTTCSSPRATTPAWSASGKVEAGPRGGDHEGRRVLDAEPPGIDAQVIVVERPPVAAPVPPHVLLALLVHLLDFVLR